MKQSNVIMTCGIPGSGKTTYSKQKEQEGYVRLSVDEIIWEDFGQYGVDYPEESYDEYTQIARKKLNQQLVGLIHKGENVIIDSSFWQKSRRDEYRLLMKDLNVTVTLVYLKAPFEVLKSRLEERNKNLNANASYAITDEILKTYWKAFEEPQDEGEIIIIQK